MFFGRLRHMLKTVGFRLALWHSAIFILGSLILFALAYLLLSSSLIQHDLEMIQLKLDELEDLYETGGMEALEREVRIEKKSVLKDVFLVRVAGPENKTLWLNIPYERSEFDLERLEGIAPDGRGNLIRLNPRGNRPALEVASILLVDGRWLQVGRSTEDRDRVLGRFRGTFTVIVIPLILLGFTGGFIIAFRALRPIRHLIKTVQSIDTRKLEVRVPSPDTGDELDELVKLFNRMLEKIGSLIRGMRDTLDNVAHDLRTPLMRLRARAEVALESGRDPTACREGLADCMEESQRILTMLNTLMDISEAETGLMKLDRSIVSISHLVDDVLEVYRYVAEEKEIAIEDRISPDVLLNADPNRLKQVIANLVDNAIKYTLKGGKIDLEAHLDGRWILIDVSDTGIGIPPGDLPRIWERLYRGDQSRSQPGLGLGLSSVRAIVEAHGGEVEVASEPGKGSTFTIRLSQEN
jgi:signal transduction histidine kinase